MNVQSILLQQLLNNGIGSLGFASGAGTAASADSAYGEQDFAELLAQLGGGQSLPQARIIPAEVALQALASRTPLSAYLDGLPDVSAEAETAASADAETFRALIEQAASRYDMDASLIQAVIHAESGYDPNAVSSAGAKGLMQLMDGTAAGLGVTNSFDPAQNIYGGTEFLSGLLDKYDQNVGVALAAYNAGPGRIDRLGIATDAELMQRLSELPAETQNYVVKVLGLQASYLAK